MAWLGAGVVSRAIGLLPQELLLAAQYVPDEISIRRRDSQEDEKPAMLWHQAVPLELTRLIGL